MADIFFPFPTVSLMLQREVVELVEDDTKIGEVLVVCITDRSKYKQFTS